MPQDCTPKLGEGRGLFMKRCLATEDQDEETCNISWGEYAEAVDDEARKVTFLKKCMAGKGASEKFCDVAWANTEKKRKAAEAMSPDTVAEVENSLQDYLNAVRAAFRASTTRLTPHTDGYDHGLWTRDVLVDHPIFGDVVITSDKGKTYAVKYTQDDEGDFAFDPVDKWTPVMMTYTLATPPKKPAVPAKEAKKKGTGSYPWDECIADQLGDGHSQDSAKRICASIKAKSQGSFKGKSRKAAFKKADVDVSSVVPAFLIEAIWEQPGTEDFDIVAFSLCELAQELLNLGARDPWALALACYETACENEVHRASLPDSSFGLILGDERLLPVRDVDGRVIPEWVDAAKEDLDDLGLLPGMEEETRRTLDHI